MSAFHIEVTLLDLTDNIERIIPTCSKTRRSKTSDSLLPTLSKEDARGNPNE